MAKPAPSRVAAALDYLERLKSQAAEFGGGVAGNLADRARSVGGLAYEALTSDPNMGRMNTAEFSEAASRPTPRLDQAAQDFGTISKAIVTQPIQTGKAIVQGEIDRAQEATTSPRAAGEYAGSFIDPMRIAAALRKTAPIAELDVYHGTPHRFPGTEENPLGEFDASKIGTGEGAQVFGHGIYYAENPDVARIYSADRAYVGAAMRGKPQAIDYDSPEWTAQQTIDEFGDSKKALAHLQMVQRTASKYQSPETKAGLQGAIDLITSGNVKPKGSLYKADLPDQMIDRMLDWNAPVDESFANKIVKAAQKNEELKLSDFEDALGISDGYLGQPEDGRAIYNLLVGSFKSDAKAAEFLRNAGIPGIRYLDSGSRDGGSGTRNFVVFPGEEKKVRILERDGQKAPPQKIAQALEAAPTESTLMKRIRELYGDYAQAYNLGLPDTPEYRRIVQEVTAQGPLSDDALLEAVRAHPGLLQAGGKARASEMRQTNRGGAAALVDSLTGQGIKTRVETSKSPGSRSTYIYASKGDNAVKIRLSDHLPAESGRVYGTNDIMTTPQHWKSAAKRALKLLKEVK